MTSYLDELVNRADLDGLVRHVDATCAARDWGHLVQIRNAARAAVATGRQLWPIATLANYRLALWAPASFAVRSLDDTARTFMPGPVSEILATNHSWNELAPVLETGHDRSLVAYERAMRGDHVTDGETTVLDIPIAVQEWEPTYALASYDDDGVGFPAPDLPACRDRRQCHPTKAIDDIDTVLAFRRLIEPWTAQSNGSASVAVADGGPEAALGALGLRVVRVATIGHREGLAQLAWAAASGGAHGKRRGTATGRSEAWWFIASFTGLSDEWPCDPAYLGEVVQSLEFIIWENDEAPTGGWGLRLVISDPDEGLSVALSAADFL